MTFHNPIIVALDSPDASTILSLVESLDGAVGLFKIGLTGFCRLGPEFVQELPSLSDTPLFLDLKLHDIPNTVYGAVTALETINPKMLTIHLLGGKSMTQAALSAVQDASMDTELLGVTVLTSMNESELHATGVSAKPMEQVLRLVELGLEAGIGSFVCSALEIEPIKREFGRDVQLVTPGIRPSDYGKKDDQSRVMTPEQAIHAGSDYLVIGRPITEAIDPAQAAEDILKTIRPN